MNKSILLIPRIKIHNANAMSSPYSIGFPSITAWLGVTHALERKLKQDARFNEDLEELEFSGVAVVCHDFKLHTYKGLHDFEHVLVGTGNPLVPKRKRKKGEPWEHFERPSFIEEARCDLTVSLLIEYDTDDDGDLVEAVTQNLHTLKMAGGDIQTFGEINLKQIHGEAEHHALMGAVMPGFCLIERRELIQQAMTEGQDALDALLDYLKVTHHCQQDNEEKVSWETKRREKGWFVPITTGFHGISELANAQHQRDPETPHRFAESIVTLAEFVMPYRMEHLDQMLWRYHADLENNLYLCQQTHTLEN